MSDLHKKKCVSCDGSIAPFEISEIHKYLKKVDGWDVKSNKDKSYYLAKDFKFNNSSSCLLVLLPANSSSSVIFTD